MPRLGSLADVVALIAAAPDGARIQVPTGLAQSTALIEALKAAPEAAADKTFTGLFIPGVDTFDYAGLHPTARMETPLMAAHLRASFEAGRVAALPYSYRKVYDRLARRGADVGIAVVTPGEGDTFSFGMAADAAPAIRSGATIKVALLNEQAPRLPASRTVQIERDLFDLIVPVDEPLNWVARETPALGVLSKVAANVAQLVEDRDTIQVGIGKLPGTILSCLGYRRYLRIWSGLYADSLIDLLDAGAIDPDMEMFAGVALGTRRLAERIATLERAHFAPVDVTHDAAQIAPRRRFVAINGALQVDLFGQVNAEFVNGRLVSGPGGLPDFVSAANLSNRGRAIIALPSLAGHESRIVVRLETPWVTLPRGLVHFVVTEHGVASLRHKTPHETAEALIAIADPSAQDALSEAWAAQRSRL